MLSVFDLDKTLINGDSYDLWHEFLLEKGILGDEYIAKNDEMIALYNRGELDMDMYIKFSEISLRAVSLDDIAKLMPEYLDSKISPIIRDKAKIWLNESKNSQIIISATPEYIVNPVSEFLGVKNFIGIRLKVKDNHYIGEYHAPLSYQDGKVDNLKIWLENSQISPKEIKFYTDSINDLPLCEYADTVVCVTPDDKLRNIAIKRGWEIVDV